MTKEVITIEEEDLIEAYHYEHQNKLTVITGRAIRSCFLNCLSFETAIYRRGTKYIKCYLQITASTKPPIREYDLKLSTGDYFGNRTRLGSVRLVQGFSEG